MGILLELRVVHLHAPVPLALSGNPSLDIVEPDSNLLQVVLFIDGERRGHGLKVVQSVNCELRATNHKLLDHIDSKNIMVRVHGHAILDINAHRNNLIVKDFPDEFISSVNVGIVCLVTIISLQEVQ